MDPAGKRNRGRPKSRSAGDPVKLGRNNCHQAAQDTAQREAIKCERLIMMMNLCFIDILKRVCACILILFIETGVTEHDTFLPVK